MAQALPAGRIGHAGRSMKAGFSRRTFNACAGSGAQTLVL